MCNNKGNCHCDVGYAPPHCSEPGHGGSVDSGPIKLVEGRVKYCLICMQYNAWLRSVGLKIFKLNGGKMDLQLSWMYFRIINCGSTLESKYI